MRCSLKNKSLTKQKKRGRLLIHIPGAWSYLYRKQVTPTHSVNVCMCYLYIPSATKLWNVLLNSKRYILPSKVIPPPCAQGIKPTGKCRFIDASAILEGKGSENRGKNKIKLVLFSKIFCFSPPPPCVVMLFDVF